MKRVLTILAAVAVTFGLMPVPIAAASLAATPATLAAAPVSIPIPGPLPGLVPPVDGCVFTAHFPLAFDNGLAWSTSDDEAFHTPLYRAGPCRSVMVQSFGVYNAPPCSWYRVKTYNEDGSVRVRGTWFQYTRVGQWGDLRRGIDVGRLFRVYSFPCEPFRGRHWPTSFQIFAR